MKHTPGPWKLQKIYGHFRVVRGNRRTQFGHQEADARLISAAPDLLAALERAYLQCIEFLNEGDFKRHVEWDAGYIVDAIAKAKGES